MEEHKLIDTLPESNSSKEEYVIRRKLAWDDIDLENAVISDIPSSTEDTQDAIGSILVDSSTIDFTYDDSTPSITAIVKDNSLGVGKLTFTATDKLAGRSTASAGAGEEITCTAAGRALLDDTDAAAQRTTLDVPSNSEAILDTVINAKGDLIVGSADNTPAILTVGATNGHVLTIDSGETTGLKWAAASGSGSGAVAQIVTGSSATKGTTAATIGQDDSIPQNTEGTEIMTVTITPTSSTNILHIDVVVLGSNSTANGSLTAALFQDSTADALAAWFKTIPGANHAQQVTFRHSMVAGTTSATTFKVRVGTNVGTVTYNGVNNARFFGGIAASRITITEAAP